MVLKDREHLNFVSVSVDSDGFLLASTLGAGSALIFFCLATLAIYFSTKTTRRQLSPITLCIILCRLAMGCIFISIGSILKTNGDIKFGSFSTVNDTCGLEAFLESTASTFHLLLGVAWLMEIADASKNPMVSSGRSRIFYILIAAGLTITLALLMVLLPFADFERVLLTELTIGCKMKESYMGLCAIPFAVYVAYLVHFFWISKRQKALQPFMAKNKDYRQMYDIVRFYNILVALYNIVAWTLLVILIKQKDVFDLEKMKTPVGRALGLWTSYGILLEFIPLLWHIRFIYAAIREKASTKDCMVTDAVFDPLRELIVEYLIKGINRAMLDGLQDTHRYCEAFMNRGTIKASPSPNQTHFEESYIISEVIKKEVYTFAFRRNKVDEKLGSAEFLLERANKLEKYVEVTVTAPKLFRIFRKYFGIDDNVVATTFSTDKLRTGELHIKLGSGRGGSFFIYPSNTRFFLKAIGKTDFIAFQQLLPQYFDHIVNHGKSFLNPILALFTIDIKGEDMIEPVHFMMMPNVLPFDRSTLPIDTKILAFDIKGSLGQRMRSLHPEKLLEIESLSKAELNATYKDVDFLKSYRTLELDKSQALPMLMQLKRDTQLLSEARIFDYSVILFMVSTQLIAPLDFASRIQILDLEKEFKLIHAKRSSTKENPCMVSIKYRKDQLRIKYINNLYTMSFHVCQQADIEILRSFLAKCKKTRVKSRGNSNALILEEEEKSVSEEIKEEDLKTSEKEELVAEYSTLFDFKQFPIPKKDVKLINFPSQTVRNQDEHCQNCKNKVKENHVVILNAKEGIRSLGVQQLVVKERKGKEAVYLWNSHLEIIDYLSKYSLKRRLEKSLKTTIMKEPSVEEPKRYADRFMKCFRTVLCADDLPVI